MSNRIGVTVLTSQQALSVGISPSVIGNESGRQEAESARVVAETARAAAEAAREAAETARVEAEAAREAALEGNIEDAIADATAAATASATAAESSATIASTKADEASTSASAAATSASTASTKANEAATSAATAATKANEASDSASAAAASALLSSNKVDKVEGKGLSTNDFSNELKSNYDAAYMHSQEQHAPNDATKNDTDANLKNRANHTGTQSADTIVDGESNKAYTSEEKAKLTGLYSIIISSTVPTTVAANTLVGVYE